MNTPPISSEAAVIASAKRRRYNIMSAIQSSFGLSNDRVIYIIFKVIIPKTFDACCNIDLITNPLTMFDWWVDYNLTVAKFASISTSRSSESLRTWHLSIKAFSTHELRTLEVENAKNKRYEWV
ncbi:hypothetical protein QR685DRAFT_513863 [Neurospora intermedia]|uniref:Uncharacterized protein n=1 Tax=Neurospora intermedia TaxID=5142 RepID=A0ABR3DVB5_NEUIN